MLKRPGLALWIPVALLALEAFSTAAHAGLVIENNLLYYSSGFNNGSSATASRAFGSLSVAGTVPKIYQIGWNVNYVSRSDNPGSGASTLSGTEMGLRVGVFLGKSQFFSFAVAWHPLANATYTAAGGSAETLQGTGYQVELGYSPQVAKSLYAGFKLVYGYVKYTSRTDATSTTSTVSYTKTGLLPVVYFSWRFGTP